MKKRILGALFCSMFLLSASLTAVKSVEAKERASIAGATTYVCTASPVASENGGKCRTLSSGNGTMCFTFGTGTACSGTANVG